MSSSSSASEGPGRGLAIVQSNNPSVLRELVVNHLGRHPLRPLEDEVVLTQSNGIGRWLQLALAATPGQGGLSGGLGISAALRFGLPARFLWDTYRIVLGDERLPEQSLFDADRLRWLVYRLVEEQAQRPGFEPIRHFLQVDEDNPRRRFQLACALADLFESYQFFRADWLADWESGEDRLATGRQRFESLPAEQAWQPMLWRALVEAGGADSAQHRARLHQDFLAALDKPAGSYAGLPRRVIVFGISSLPEQILRALAALSKHSQVLVCLHNPCRYYWGNIVEARDDFRRWNARHRIKHDKTLGEMPVGELADTEFEQWANPLLASWGKQGRDFIQLLDEMDRPEDYENWFDDGIDLFEDIDDCQAGRLLGQLQQDILDLEPPPAPDKRKSVDPDDDSLTFTIAHSRQREVEILYDRLLEAFERDESLQPREVIVMVPDIDAYAPHIDAVFGNLAMVDEEQRRDRRFIPYTIGDRNDRVQSGFLRAVVDLMDLPRSRFTGAEVLDLLHIPALRERFDLFEADLELIASWVEGSGVRWGLDEDHRSRLLDNEQGFEQNSWRHGLDRMLLGYATGRADSYGNVLPYDEVSPGSAELAGKLAALIERLRHWHTELSRPATPVGWIGRLGEMVDDCLATGDGDDSLARHHFDQALERLVEDTAQADMTEELSLEVVRDVVLAELDQHRVSKRFLAGRVNFSTLMPMRAIPFMMVCLLGMNDGDYPRTRKPADFDLMNDYRRPGDRSRRDDDRYLFLEALLSARRRLYISWIGRSIRDHETIPPSVLVGQLRDAIAGGWVLEQDSGPEAGQCLLDRLTTEHPLQPFSRAYFDPDRQQLRTYASEWGEVWQKTSKAVEGSGDVALSPHEPEGSLSLRDLESFYRSPVRAFMNGRLGVRLRKGDDLSPPVEDEPFELDGLQSWALRDELLRRLMLEDVAPATEGGMKQELEAIAEKQLRVVRLEGRLPLKSFGHKVEKEALDEAISLGERYFAQLSEFPTMRKPILVRFRHKYAQEDESVEVRLEDWIGQVRESANGSLARIHLLASKVQNSKARNVTRANVRWDKLAGYWPAHLAACAEGLELTTIIVGADNEAYLEPIQTKEAQALLKTLLEQWVTGLSRPLPALPVLSGEYVRQLETRRKKNEDEHEQEWLDDMRARLGRLYENEQGSGDRKRLAVRDTNVDMARVFPDFRSMWDLPEGEGFRAWSEHIYCPLVLSQK